MIGATSLIDYAGDTLVSSLISGICDRGNNAGAISELLGKLLFQLRLDMDDQAGLVKRSTAVNKKERRRMEKERDQSSSRSGE